MDIYLLKSTAILAIFWGIYVLFLERENMHRFKRFYLLASTVAAICIPLIAITQYVYVAPIDASLFQNEIIPFEIITPKTIVKTPFWTLETVLWLIYSIGASLFAIRFVANLFRIYKTIHKNEQVNKKPFTYVLLQKLSIPHTFFNYIFLNKQKFTTNNIPKEVLLHEETHAKQKHSLDVFFIELLQVVFWFQPFIWLYKKRIKLNHEFLADQAVLEQGYNPANYQTILLSFSSFDNTSQNHQAYSLTNAINYSSIKKRFTVMKTQTSKTKIWVRSLLLLPLIAILFYSFTEREVVEIKTKIETPQDIDYELRVDASGDIYYNDVIIFLENIENSILLSDGMKITLNLDSDYNSEHLEDLMKKVMNTITQKGVKISSVCSSQNFDDDSKQNPPTAKEIAEYNAWAKKMKAKFKKMPESDKVEGYPHMISDETFRRHNLVYDRMSETQKNNAETLPEAVLVMEWPMQTATIVSTVSDQKNPPTAKAISAYNAWAKSMSQKIEDTTTGKSKSYPIYKAREVTKYESIYKRMTGKQRESVQAFPNIPPPPPPAMDTIYTYNRLMHRIKTNPNNRKANIIYLNKIYNDMSSSQKGKVENPNSVKSLNQQNIPTAKEIAAYNTWAKSMSQKIENAVSGKSKSYPIIKAKDITKYESIYNRMTDKQRLSAEPFPNIPPPPPPPPTKAPSYKNGKKKTLKEIIKDTPKNVKSGYEMLDNGETHYFIENKGKKTYYNKDGFITDNTGKILPPPPPAPPAPKKSGSNKGKGGPTINSFEIVFQKVNKKIELKCIKGCAWANLKFELSDNTPQIINKYGLNKVDTRNSDKSFYFVLLQDENSFDLKSTKNTSWKGLSSSNKEKMNMVLTNDDVKRIKI